ncbi:hypothetical protein LCI18_003854 [Fusarium solani-melongenae]|uniref:Uncharacterized protein n=1 Tax=Fusarium solani subsp. cucurbitae TaxID=2747967 RepID=A0ACD3YVC4_FUSSC|nr:hypothetical protein LCI18_003854 [Fusarium solani-melongenae]
MKSSLPVTIQFRQDSVLNKGKLKETLFKIFGSTYWTLSEGPDTFYVEVAHEPSVCVVSALEVAGAIKTRSVDEPSAIRDEDSTESKQTKTDVEEKPAIKAKKKKRAGVKSRQEKSVRKSYDVADEEGMQEPLRPRDDSDGTGMAMAPNKRS